MMRPLVIHVITRLELGGAQENTLDTCARLDRSRFDVALLAGPGGVLDERARAIDGLDFETIPSLVRPVAPLSDLRAVAELRTALRARTTGRPALVHTHSSKAGILGRRAARALGLPAIHTVHGFGFPAFGSLLFRDLAIRLERRAAADTTRFVVVSRENEEVGRRLGLFGAPPRPVTLIRSGIDVERFREARGRRAAARERLCMREGGPLVGTISAMKRQKGLDVWLRVARGVLDAAPTARFVVIGDGPDRARLSRLRERLGLDHAVRFTGARDDVAEVLPAFDAFLLTSRWEGLPRALVSAMAAGVPCVATAAGGSRDVVKDGETGMLAPVDSVPAITEKLMQVLRDPERGRSLAERAALQVAEFDVRAMIAELESLYFEVLAGGAAPISTSR